MLRQAQHQFTFETRGPAFIEITGEVGDWVAAQGLSTGLLTLFCRHTSASLTIQENADPDVLRDLAAFLQRIAPEDGGRYAHDTEGPDDMPAHIKSMVTGAHLSIPVAEGRIALGTWQGVYLCEHRTAPHRRTVLLHLIGA